MKFKKDLALSLATFEGLMLALLVAMPIWLLAVVITLTVVGAILTVVSIINMRKASVDEETGKPTYRFPIWTFVIGAVLLAALTVGVMLACKRLFGFALIPLAVVLLALCVIALLRHWKVVFVTMAIVVALLAVFLISYGTAYMAHHDISLNPGLVASEPAGDESQLPNDEIEKPGETEKPGDEKPGDETEKPGDETPGDTTTPPATTVKIDAPDTLSYGKPITVKLEGCKVDDLVFGNEDFIAISKISDTEVSIILVGIVNETTGQVEIVPASGYVTITDSVSGTNVSINIVE